MKDTLFNGRFLTRAVTGVDRFATELLRSVAAATGAPVELAVPSTALGPARELGFPLHLHEVRGFAGQVWEQVPLAWHARGRPLVNLCNTAPVAKTDQLVVIHDAATLANPANFSPQFRGWYRLLHGALMRRAGVIATVSAFSADELVRHLGARRDGIELIREGGEHILHRPADGAIIDRLGLADRRYVLAVGTQSPNKNVAAAIKAVSGLGDNDIGLVLAGTVNSRVWATAPVSGAGLIAAGHVTDGELRALYENALCFVFPSFYEGFGLPPLEAMCCGCPVIVSSRASLPEVCGEAALYCDPDDPSTLKVQLERLLDSAGLQSELREAGLARASTFGWEKGAADLIEIMKDRLS